MQDSTGSNSGSPSISMVDNSACCEAGIVAGLDETDTLIQACTVITTYTYTASVCAETIGAVDPRGGSNYIMVTDRNVGDVNTCCMAGYDASDYSILSQELISACPMTETFTFTSTGTSTPASPYTFDVEVQEGDCTKNVHIWDVNSSTELEINSEASTRPLCCTYGIGTGN
jgi:hypothetical protein